MINIEMTPVQSETYNRLKSNVREGRFCLRRETVGRGSLTGAKEALLLRNQHRATESSLNESFDFIYV